MATNNNTTTFTYPHRIGILAVVPPPISVPDPIDWEYCVIGRVWDMRVYEIELVQQLVDRFWHLRQPVRVRPFNDDFLFQCFNEQDASDLDI